MTINLLFKPLIVLLAFGISASAANATPLSLDYSVTALSGGSYKYDFKLTLDNHDNSWSSGNGWSWLTFGDANSSSSPLTNFLIDPASLPVGPWTSLAFSSGGHNGPTFLMGNGSTQYWIPTSIGSYLEWSGTSNADLPQGNLLFSTLLTTGGGVAAVFETADRVQALNSVPEPASLALLGLGLAAIGLSRRKKI